jgi:DNA-binding HxlR family transcriptional regulator
METKDSAAEWQCKCDALSDQDAALAREIVGRVSDRWSLWTMHVLATGGRLRFSRVLERVEGVSQKMLTKTLRQLERDGLVTRTMYLEVPPRVEYELTAVGRALLLHVLPLWDWIAENVSVFKAARKRFNKQTSKSLSP